ncbi:Sec-independent protein translocase protein TATA, chloroplastic [Zostera marina]|uniref:Sec-independent protein translocase protein TATA, chloroplastic n=1 Tax=Zostera marina TaxID=29655 RepID=A0A0K9PEM9_ZOSMR|nr:Sec-independent protein translocase protein TATA, chloroplastic [Zostera marina]
MVSAGIGVGLPKSSTSLSSTNCAFFRTNEMRMAASFSVNSERRVPLLSIRRRGGVRRVGECKCLFGLGVPELAVIAGVAALVFGPKKLPEIGRNFGKTIKSFQEAAKEFETELKKEPSEKDNSTTAAASSAAIDKLESSSENKVESSSDTKENA